MNMVYDTITAGVMMQHKNKNSLTLQQKNI